MPHHFIARLTEGGGPAPRDELRNLIDQARSSPTMTAWLGLDLLDENVRGQLGNAILSHDAAGIDIIDALRVGQASGPPPGTPDPALLIGAEGEGRNLVTGDKATMPTHLERHLRSGRGSPGILMLRSRRSLAAIIEYILLATLAGDPSDFEGRITHIP